MAGSAGFGAAGVLSGYVRLAGDSAIEFKSGEITSLAASAHLGLVGSDALIEDSTATGSNSALTGLASIGAGALFALHDGAAVSTTGALVNDGEVVLDTNAGDGGSSLTVAGTLTNSGSLTIGNATLSASDEVTAASLDNKGRIQLTGSGANQALLDVTGRAGFGAAGVLSGNVNLSGDSAIEFASGQITSLAAGAQLFLDGAHAFIEDSTAPGSNSALQGLSNIYGILSLDDGASLSTTGALAIASDGINLNRTGGGGSSLTVAGALTNNGFLYLGNTALSASDKVTAASLDNTGSIYLNGSSADQALLDVTTGSAGFGAAGVLSGYVGLDGDSAIEFTSGQITSLTGSLSLNGTDAFIEDSTALGSNSALTGLASIGAGATLLLLNNAAVSTTGALVNDGTVIVDGGSSLTVAGALTNTGYLGISGGFCTVGTLSNSGSISIINGGTLDVTSGVAGFGTAGTVTGSVNVPLGTVKFVSGQISTIAAGSSLGLTSGLIEDSTALGSNSALTGLSDIAGSPNLFFGAAVSTTGSLVNIAGSLVLSGGSLSTTGAVANSGLVSLGTTRGTTASTLSIGGALTNSGMLSISAIGSVTAESFVNTGTADLIGLKRIGGLADLDVSGATTNNGSISIGDETEEVAGAVSGTGSFSLNNANLQFDSSVSSGQTIKETGADGLTLKEAQSFAATIKGFGTGDTIDATNFLETATSYNFVENIAGTGGTLTLTDTSSSLTANIQMTGHYSKSDFTLAPDSGSGTLVKFV